MRISIFFVNCCNIFYGEYNSEIIEKIVTAPIPTPTIPTNTANIKNFFDCSYQNHNFFIIYLLNMRALMIDKHPKIASSRRTVSVP